MRLVNFDSSFGEKLYINIDQIVLIKRVEGRTSTSTEITTTANANGHHTIEVRETLEDVVRAVEAAKRGPAS